MKAAAKPNPLGGSASYYIELFRKRIIDSKIKEGELCELSKFNVKFTAVYFGSLYTDYHIFYIRGNFQAISGVNESFMRTL